MRPTELLSRIIFNLIPLACVVGLGWAAVRLLRRAGPPQPPGRDRAVSPWTGRLILYALASFLVAWPFAPSPVHPTQPLMALSIFVAVFGLLVLLTLATPWLAGDRILRRASRRADRGDVAGAIVALQAVLDRPAGDAGPAPAASPSPGPADPWATPTGTIWRDLRAAHRLNLMGRLYGSRGGWAEALGWFRRAEAAGGPEPVFRLNVGLARVKLGEEAAGLAAMRDALADAPAHLPLHRFEFALVLGRTLAEAGRAAEARARLNEAAAALYAARVHPRARRKRLAGAIADARALLPPPLPGEPDLDAGGGRD